MTNLVWPTGTASIVVLPSGTEGERLLSLAKQWSASWLLSPAFWVVESQIPDPSDEVPVVKAYVLGRNSQGNPDLREVDLFYALNSQVFQLIRLLAIRVKQSTEGQEITSKKIRYLAKYLDSAKPYMRVGSKVGSVGTKFIKLNLVFSQSGESSVIPKSVIQDDWDANIIAAPEDRTTPGSFDSFVRDNSRHDGFVLAHVATAAGIWAGLPKSTYEFGELHPAVGRVRMQRVFVRAIATDKLSGDLAKWALEKAASPDNENALGIVSGREVASIASGRVTGKVESIIEYMLAGVDDADFLYHHLPSNIWRKESRRGILHKFGVRIRDFIEAFKYLPLWTVEKINQRIDPDENEEVSKNYLPPRLDPRFDLIKADEIINQPRPKIHHTGPELWRHVREALASAIDSPPNVPLPDLLRGDNGERLIFGDTRIVLPDPDDVWDEPELAEAAGVHLTRLKWLDVTGAEQQKEMLNQKKIELAPGMEEARAEMKQTSDELSSAIEAERQAVLELERAEFELLQDIDFADEMRSDHTHSLPINLVGPPRPSVSDLSLTEQSTSQVNPDLSANYSEQLAEIKVEAKSEPEPNNE